MCPQDFGKRTLQGRRSRNQGGNLRPRSKWHFRSGPLGHRRRRHCRCRSRRRASSRRSSNIQGSLHPRGTLRIHNNRSGGSCSPCPRRTPNKSRRPARRRARNTRRLRGSGEATDSPRWLVAATSRPRRCRNQCRRLRPRAAKDSGKGAGSRWWGRRLERRGRCRGRRLAQRHPRLGWARCPRRPPRLLLRNLREVRGQPEGQSLLPRLMLASACCVLQGALEAKGVPPRCASLQRFVCGDDRSRQSPAGSHSVPRHD